MSQTHTEDRVATLHALLNDAAKKVGEQRQTIDALASALASVRYCQHPTKPCATCQRVIDAALARAGAFGPIQLKATGEAT